MSASRIPARNPSLANARDRLATNYKQTIFTQAFRSIPATVLLPTPPFAEDTAMTLSTPVIFRL